MATENAPHGKVDSVEGTMFADGLYSILAARGREAAGRWRQRGNKALVEADGSNEDGR